MTRRALAPRRRVSERASERTTRRPRGRTGASARALERRADEAAARALRGQPVPASQLGAGPIARADAAGSRGAPLPHDLRGWLESRFAADLSGLRLHTDAAADAAAAALGARGFAAGADVYLRASLDLHAESGRRLLAHETAHALQQVGVAGPDGRLHLRPAAGSAPPQLAPDEFVKNAEDYGLFGATPAGLPDVEAAYQAVPDIATHVAIIHWILGPTLPASPTQIEAIADETKKPGFASLSDELKGFYVDVLKWLSAFKEAGAALIANPTARSSWRSKGLYADLRGRSLAWLPALVRAHPFLKAYYPGKLLDAYRVAFFAPGLDPIDLDADAAAGKSGATPFRDRLLKEMSAFKKATGLAGNELEGAALLAFYYLDDDRRRWMKQVRDDTRARHPELDWISVAATVANRYTAADIKAGDGGQMGNADPERLALFGDLYPDIQPVAARAVAAWTRISQLAVAALSGKAFETMDVAETRALALKVTTDARFKDLPKFLAERGRAITARAKGELPLPKAFAATVKQQRELVRLRIARYGILMADLARGKLEGGFPALVLGLAIWLAQRIDRSLRSYDPAADEAAHAKGMADHRIAARLRLAADLVMIGVFFDWDEVRGVGNDVYREGTRISMLGDWKEDTHPSPDALAKDTSPDISGWESTGITPSLLELFAYVGYYDALADAIRKLRTARGSDFTLRPKSIVGEAAEKTGRTSMARRYVLAPWEYGDPTLAQTKPGERRVSGFIDWSSIFDDHPKGKEIKAKIGPGEMSLTPVNPPVSGQLVVWIFPRVAELAKRLSGLPGVADAVKAHWEANHPTSEPAPDPSRYIDWLDALGLLAEDLANLGKADKAKQAALEKLKKAIEEAVMADLGAAEQRAHVEGRLATTHLRQAFVLDIHARLGRYDRFDLRTDWNIPYLVFDEISNFAASVYPHKDQTIQVAALVHELAGELMTAFGPVERTLLDSPVIRSYGIVDPLLTLLWGALKTWDEAEAAHDKAQKAAKPGETVPPNPIVEISTMDVPTLAVSRAALRSLLGSLREYAVKEQKRGGISAVKNKDLTGVYLDQHGSSLLKLGMSSTVIKEGGEFWVGQTAYKIDTIHESFTFHHPFSTERRTLGVNWGAGKRPGDAILLDGDGKEMAPTGRPLITYTWLGNQAHGQETLTDRDLGKLSAFAGYVSEWFSFEYLRGAGVVVQKLALWQLEILGEVVPGVSEITFATTVLQIAFSPEVWALLGEIREKGFGAFPDIFKFLRDFIKIDELANVLIFEADWAGPTKAHEKLKPQSRRGEAEAVSKGGVWTALWKMLKNIFEIGIRVLDAIKRVVKRVQTPVRQAQLWVLRHPAAILILDLIEVAWEYLKALSEENLEEFAEGVLEGDWKGTLKKAITEALQGILDRGRDMLDRLRTLEMPSEIVAVELIVDAILDLAISALKGKYRLIGKALRGLLSTLGILGKIESRIADGLKTSGMDPNKFYQKEVRDRINPWFTEKRDEFVGELLAFLQRIPILNQLTQPTGTPIDIEFGGFGFEGHPAEGAPDGAGTPPLTPPSSVSFAGGGPLPVGVRSRAELDLGHDFAHVRLHRGPDADRLTRSLSSDALTSGSHVFMRSGLPLGEGRGTRVLRHELGHVLQQTGPRPLGDPHAGAPTGGSPGRGLVYDPAHEAAADRAAARAPGRGVQAGPIAVGGGGGGLQPSLSEEFIKKFLGRLKSRKDIREAREELRKAPKPSLGTETEALVSTISKSLSTLLQGTKATFEPPFNHAKASFQKLLKDQWAEVDRTLAILAARATTDVKDATASADEPDKRVAWLDPDAFKTHLERELFGVTAMAIVVELGTKEGSAAQKKRPVINAADPVKSVTVGYVDLPLLEANDESEKIWDLLVHNSFAGVGKKLVASELATYKAATKLILGRTGPQYDTYDRIEFRLSERKIKVVRGQRERINLLVAGDWPTPDDYVNPEATAVPANVKSIGMRLGTYASWKSGSTNGGVPDRDAHHTVQFLLLDYFRNGKGFKPFPLLKDVAVPGISRDGGEVKTITGDAGTIDIAGFQPGRGGKMPTIYISRHTHQSGVHYKTEPPDEEPARPSQGAALHNAWTTFIGSLADVLEDKEVLKALNRKKKSEENDPVDLADPDGSKAAAATSKKGGKPAAVPPPPTPAPAATTKKKSGFVTVKRLREGIISATRKCYADMWNDMRPKLHDKLVEQEVPYYNTVAAQKKMTDRMTPALIISKFQDIVTRTESVIGQTAGFAPAKGP